ncbi:DUF615 domain-containing protein [Ideonella sp. 4Y16]|uniref:Dual-action ribosomal maturation protein DarP n=1 Tax=Ideonella alba TaxID=2824118 RepID=A0A941BF68_9BURK|nr:ribosome biogenesis factor YjgA [Ideonella alba]MBQ0930737.1 DUF615 domain-containing protein [Ideonella alba]MBQ0944852.1 DUF615 domain-containing protein [Ideonella alba]
MRSAPAHLDPPDDDFSARPSKSALKRQSHDLQALGRALSELPASRLEALALPETLAGAIADYRRIRSHEGLRRQLQYIGKLMRQVDPAPLQAAVDDFRLGGARQSLALHTAERWREQLLADDSALTRWLAEHPDTGAQQLRSLVRAARKDAQPDTATGAVRHGRAYRELFQLIKQALAQADAADDDTEENDDE